MSEPDQRDRPTPWNGGRLPDDPNAAARADRIALAASVEYDAGHADQSVAHVSVSEAVQQMARRNVPRSATLMSMREVVSDDEVVAALEPHLDERDAVTPGCGDVAARRLLEVLQAQGWRVVR